ncbi:MAG: DUF983 domain-containing protein [Caulobacter sp.]|jgi:uncharacterized protein (DUF983 family)|uniref:DUF983 domain-containing protein n=1 Tax=Caulobacter sp. CCH9-E1 TaxID=1768768 RepID=UPI000829D08E|nr:DUF983 domain-containing protein [Caulobacter sp. CCH9-E1]MCK5909389.1 DUF983 domain-containing protein [Caulobacter sp.]
MTKTNPYAAGARGLCPHCGEGYLFDGFLKVTPVCEACGFELGKYETGDGAATFVILIAGTVCAFGALFSMFAWNWPVWLLLLVWLPAVFVITLGLMRPAKGLMVAAQIAQKASEAGRRDV